MEKRSLDLPENEAVTSKQRPLRPFHPRLSPEPIYSVSTRKRLQALSLGGPAAVVGGLVATLAALVNGQLALVVPTLQGCAVFAAISLLISQVAKRLEK